MKPMAVTQTIVEMLEGALAHHRAGRLAEAEKRYARIRAAAPRCFDAFNLSGFLALQENRFADAVALLTHAARLDRNSAQCALRLAHALKALGRFAEAHAEARRAAVLEPKNGDAHFCLGELAAVTEGFAAAVPYFRRATELQPNAADTWANLGVALVQAGGAAEAVACFERALKLDPGNGQALTGQGLALQQAHRIAEAAEIYRRVLLRDPENHQARSARLLALHYLDDVERVELKAEHEAFGAAVRRRKMAVPLRNSAEPERRLRVGFLSPDLRAHSVAFFLEPLLAGLDRGAFEVVLYHDHVTVDVVSQRLRMRADLWRQVAGWSDDRLEAAIRVDAPDVLVDLAGHTGLNRLPLYARRLAPVQITYLGYPNTTGLAEMDYRFTDPVADPMGEEVWHTEKLVRFGPTAWAYAPPAEAPAPARDDDAGESVVLGCFNNFSKVSDAMLGLWARILATVPRSRLLVKSQGLDDSEQAARLRRRLKEVGVSEERVEALGRTAGIAAHLAKYGKIDLALDTYPYHGTTTTCEALWMGVPVVTLAGDRHVSRVSASLLTAVGHPEWIARMPDDYVRIASELAMAGPRTTEMRRMLRDTLQASPLLDHAGQAKRFGAAIRECWREWCTQTLAGASVR